MPLITTKPAQLPEDIGMYVDALRKRYTAIDEVWFLGPRDDVPEPQDRTLKLIMFADTDVLNAIRVEPEWHREDLHLLVAVDGDHYEEAWGARERGRLSDIEWRMEDLHTATYMDARASSRSESRAVATRVR